MNIVEPARNLVPVACGKVVRDEYYEEIEGNIHKITKILESKQNFNLIHTSMKTIEPQHNLVLVA